MSNASLLRQQASRIRVDEVTSSTIDKLLLYRETLDAMADVVEANTLKMTVGSIGVFLQDVTQVIIGIDDSRDVDPRAKNRALSELRNAKTELLLALDHLETKQTRSRTYIKCLLNFSQYARKTANHVEY